MHKSNITVGRGAPEPIRSGRSRKTTCGNDRRTENPPNLFVGSVKKIKPVLYSTGCPRCKMLEKALVDAGIEYDLCTDVDTIVGLGVKFVPVLEVVSNDDDKLMDYTAAMGWVRLQGGAQ